MPPSMQVGLICIVCGRTDRRLQPIGDVPAAGRHPMGRCLDRVLLNQDTKH